MPLSPRSAGAAAAAAVSPVPGSKMAPGTRAASARPPPRWRPEVASCGRKLLRPAGNGFTRPEVASLGRKWLPLPDGCLRQSGAGFFCFASPRFKNTSKRSKASRCEANRVLPPCSVRAEFGVENPSIIIIIIKVFPIPQRPQCRVQSFPVTSRDGGDSKTPWADSSKVWPPFPAGNSS